jgi:hypothetical protein
MALAAVGSACGRRPPDAAAAPLGPPAVGLRHCPVPGTDPTWSGSRLPAGYVAVEVFDCRTEPRRVPGRGEWVFLQERRATGDVSAYLAALRSKDERQPREANCLANFVPDPPVILVDAVGTAIHPRSPRDSCGKPQQRVLDAYAALTFRRVGEVRLQQVTPQVAFDTGCAGSWKDEVAVEKEATPAGPNEYWFAMGHVQVRACLYRAGSDGLDMLEGHLESGGVARGAAAKRLVRALEQTPPPAPCGKPHTRFALLHDDASGYLYVELDGCRRVMTEARTWRQGDARLVAMIEQLGRAQ